MCRNRGFISAIPSAQSTAHSAKLIQKGNKFVKAAVTVSFSRNSQLVPWAVQSFCLEQPCCLERQNKAGGWERNLKPQVLNSSTAEAFSTLKNCVVQMCSVTCYVQALEDVLETAAPFSFGSNNIPS